MIAGLLTTKLILQNLHSISLKISVTSPSLATNMGKVLPYDIT
jgi:hypothetical protein